MGYGDGRECGFLLTIADLDRCPGKRKGCRLDLVGKPGSSRVEGVVRVPKSSRATIVIASKLMGERRAFLHTIKCLCSMFSFSRLGLATDYAPLFDGVTGSWSHSLDTGDGDRGGGDSQ